ncbi:peptidase inhibitor family I36 protein [Longispora sp. NPDC051575]|uniref:peptidase inhibitor family I36 protein n=1 Tax=Longispora sp. NPDC051575 TaxID=3154943 RepID=UPI00342C9531
MSGLPLDSVSLFTDRGFTGTRQDLVPGRYDVGALTLGDNALSSLRVPQGWSVTVFSDPGFAGTSTTFHASAEYVGDELNDRVSSVEVRDTPVIVRVGGASNDGGVIFLEKVYNTGR